MSNNMNLVQSDPHGTLSGAAVPEYGLPQIRQGLLDRGQMSSDVPEYKAADTLKNLGRVGKVLDNMYQKELDDIDAAEYANSLTDYRRRVLEKRAQWTAMHGEDALRPDDKGRGLTAREDEDNLKMQGDYKFRNPDMAFKFKKAAETIRTDEMAALNAHVVRENDTYIVNRGASTALNAVTAAGIAGAGGDLTTMRQVVDSDVTRGVDIMADRLGMSPEQREAEKRKYTESAVRAALVGISGRCEDRPGISEVKLMGRVLEEFKDRLAPADYKELRGYVRTRMESANAQALRHAGAYDANVTIGRGGSTGGVYTSSDFSYTPPEEGGVRRETSTTSVLYARGQAPAGTPATEAGPATVVGPATQKRAVKNFGNGVHADVVTDGSPDGDASFAVATLGDATVGAIFSAERSNTSALSGDSVSERKGFGSIKVSPDAYYENRDALNRSSTTPDPADPKSSLPEKVQFIENAADQNAAAAYLLYASQLANGGPITPAVSTRAALQAIHGKERAEEIWAAANDSTQATRTMNGALKFVDSGNQRDWDEAVSISQSLRRAGEAANVRMYAGEITRLKERPKIVEPSFAEVSAKIYAIDPRARIDSALFGKMYSNYLSTWKSEAERLVDAQYTQNLIKAAELTARTGKPVSAWESAKLKMELLKMDQEHLLQFLNATNGGEGLLTKEHQTQVLSLAQKYSEDTAGRQTAVDDARAGKLHPRYGMTDSQYKTLRQDTARWLEDQGVAKGPSNDNERYAAAEHILDGFSAMLQREGTGSLSEGELLRRLRAYMAHDKSISSSMFGTLYFADPQTLRDWYDDLPNFGSAAFIDMSSVGVDSPYMLASALRNVYADYSREYLGMKDISDATDMQLGAALSSLRYGGATSSMYTLANAREVFVKRGMTKVFDDFVSRLTAERGQRAPSLPDVLAAIDYELYKAAGGADSRYNGRTP